MKTLVSLLLLFVFSVAHAEDQVKMQNGKLMIGTTRWNDSGVNITPDAQKYPTAVIEAYRTPFKEISLEQKTVKKVTGLFSYQIDTFQSGGVIYNNVHNTIDVTEPRVVRVKEAFSSYFIFWLLSVVAFSLFMVKRTFHLAVVACVSVITGAFASSALISPVTVTLAVVGALSAPSAEIANGRSELTFLMSATAFYVLMFMAIGVEYSSLL